MTETKIPTDEEICEWARSQKILGAVHYASDGLMEVIQKARAAGREEESARVSSTNYREAIWKDGFQEGVERAKNQIELWFDCELGTDIREMLDREILNKEPAS